MKRCFNCFGEYADVFGICPFCGNSAGCQEAEGKALKPGVMLRQRYFIGKTAGSGGFGITYRAWDEVLSRKAAVKEFFPHRIADRDPDGERILVAGPAETDFERGKNRFLNEARILSGIRETGQIPRVSDYFEENGTAYIVMEMLEGRTLSSYLGSPGRRVSPDFAIFTVCECAAAVSVLHRKGFVHGDIAPDNVFVSADGSGTVIKLIDFGAARPSGQRISEREVVYKPGFSPPEKYRAGKALKQSDVYSLAATLYLLLTGVLPVPADKRAAGERLPAPSELVKGISPRLSGLITEAMSEDPAKRPRDADAFVTGLKRAFGKKKLPKTEKNTVPDHAFDENPPEDPMLLYDLAVRGDAVGTTHPIPERLLPGTMIHDRYSVGLEFRRAGVCAVYSGVDMLLDTEIRIYEYFPEEFCRRDVDGVNVKVTDTIGRFSDGLDAFLREAVLLTRDSGAPRRGTEYFTGMVKAGGTGYLITEDRGEIPLRKYLCYLRRGPFGRRGTVAPRELDRMLGDLLSGIDDEAEEGVSFGAISPDSVLVGRDGRAILRFPARVFYPGFKIDGRKFGFYFKGYTAPELRDAAPDTPESDVYSLAAVICRMITGERPPDGKDRTAAAAGRYTDPLLTYLGKHRVPDNLAERIIRAMNLSPVARGRARDLLGKG
ncbi:MAG: protein kinase [Clostridia bacterium]|nr:protein kinase [Clostridia bacterium]